MKLLFYRTLHLAIAVRRFLILVFLVAISFASLNPWHAAIVLLGIVLACDFAGERP